jgi:hypothetical protein
MNVPKLAFELRRVKLSLDCLLPVRVRKEEEIHRNKYRRIVASIKEVGLVEPLVVFPQTTDPVTYLLLDGHLRYHALRELGEKEADCVISLDDESFTYNARVNGLTAIQEHQMILKAVEHGVSEKRIAVALKMHVRRVNASLRLLEGIHADAVRLLKDKPIGPKAIKVFRKVKGLRQIEMAELMKSANNFTQAYAEALFAGTSNDQLVTPEKPKERCVSAKDICRMQNEIRKLENDFRSVQQRYGPNMLTYAVVRGYLRSLFENSAVEKFLRAHYLELHKELQTIVQSDELLNEETGGALNETEHTGRWSSG